MIKNKIELFYEKNIDKNVKDVNLEKGDFTAIVIAAFITLMPVLLMVFAIFGLFIFWIYGK